MSNYEDFDENGFYKGRFSDAINAEKKRQPEQPIINDAKKPKRTYVHWNEEQEYFLVTQVMKHKLYMKTLEKKDDKLKKIVKAIQESPLFEDVKNQVVFLPSLLSYLSYFILQCLKPHSIDMKWLKQSERENQDCAIEKEGLNLSALPEQRSQLYTLVLSIEDAKEEKSEKQKILENNLLVHTS